MYCAFIAKKVKVWKTFFEILTLHFPLLDLEILLSFRIFSFRFFVNIFVYIKDYYFLKKKKKKKMGFENYNSWIVWINNTCTLQNLFILFQAHVELFIATTNGKFPKWW